VSARLGVAYLDGDRRCLWVTGGETASRFVGCRASRQACVGEGVAGDQAKLQSFTAVLEVALIGDGEDGRAARV
jgi:hypothetical protein